VWTDLIKMNAGTSKKVTWSDVQNPIIAMGDKDAIGGHFPEASLTLQASGARIMRFISGRD
jgi:hypothetical protein